MLAALPLGDPLCLVIPQCRLHMTKMALKFYSHLRYQDFAWAQTRSMHQYFNAWSCCGNGTVFPGSPSVPIGVTAPLVLSLALAGHRIEHIRLSDDATHLQLRTDRTRVDYFSRTISPDPSVCERRRTSILACSQTRTRPSLTPRSLAALLHMSQGPRSSTRCGTPCSVGRCTRHFSKAPRTLAGY